MGSTEAPAITPLRPADLEGAQALVAEARWNQLPADWQLFLELGAAWKVEDEGGAVVATAAVLPFDRFGWISMVLVTQARRRQGLATALLAHGIAHLRASGRVPVLDATPAGRTVYGPLGFRDGWAITRWRRTAPGPIRPDAPRVTAPVRPLRADDWPAIEAMDRRAFGADRGPVLRRLHARSRGFACVLEQHGKVAGFLLARGGRQATQLGPLVIDSGTAPAGGAEALLAHALERVPGPVLLDALDSHAALRPWLAGAAFEVERGYTRMALDAVPNFGDAAATVAIAGPELG